ncbi:MAG: division/cell wall cluster transcriptional repressor MraZ [Chloroflexota bacterium]
MFLGRVIHSIDEKNRLAIPARYRSQLAGGIYLTKGADRCLYILTPEGWSRFTERIMALPTMHADARQLQRHFFAGADHMIPDRLGRIIIPQHLREYAALTSDVVVAGVQTRIELWNRETWEAEEAQVDQGSQDVAARFALIGDQPGSLGI